MVLKLTKNKAFSVRGKIDGYYTDAVTKFGNGAKIGSSNDFIGRNVIVFVLKKGESL